MIIFDLVKFTYQVVWNYQYCEKCNRFTLHRNNTCWESLKEYTAGKHL